MGLAFKQLTFSSVFEGNKYFVGSPSPRPPSPYIPPPFSPLPLPGPTPSLYKIEQRLEDSAIWECRSFPDIMEFLSTLTTLPNKFETLEIIRRLLFAEMETRDVFSLLVSNGGYLLLQGIAMTAHLFSVSELCQALDCLESLGFTSSSVLCVHLFNLLNNEGYDDLPLVEAAVFAEVVISLHRKDSTCLTKSVVAGLRRYFADRSLTVLDKHSKRNIFGFMCLPPAHSGFGRRVLGDENNRDLYLLTLKSFDPQLYAAFNEG